MNRPAAPLAARYALGPLELDADRLVLCLAGEPLALGPRAVATLAALVERAGEVVTKDEILDAVWAGEDVGESNVAQSVYVLRKVLREHGLGNAIATVQRRGYRFTAPVERVVPEPVRIAGIAAQPLSAGIAPQHGPAQGTAGARASRSRWLTAALAVVLVLVAAVPAARAVPHAPPLSARGAELYRLGRFYWNLRTPAGLAKSARLFAAVVASNPRSPLGYDGLADVDLMTADYHAKALNERPRALAPYLAHARAHIATALALDPGCAPAHASLAMLRFAANHDKRGAEAEFRRAIALDPSYAVAHHWYGTTLLDGGRLAEASRELHAAIVLDPVSTATGSWLAEASYYQHRYADAIAYAHLALDLDPDRSDALRQLGLAYEQTGDYARAIAAFKRLRTDRVLGGDAAALLAEAYARSGQRNAARAAFRGAHHADTGNAALALIALGDRTRGLAMIGGMQKKYGPPALLDPRFEPFRAELHLKSERADTSS